MIYGIQFQFLEGHDAGKEHICSSGPSKHLENDKNELYAIFPSFVFYNIKNVIYVFYFLNLNMKFKFFYHFGLQISRKK